MKLSFNFLRWCTSIWSVIIVYFGYKYDESVVPEGPYCYVPDVEKNKNKKDDDYSYYIKTCDYFVFISREKKCCKLLGIITDDDVFGDQCKMCKVNDNYRYDIEKPKN